MNIETISPEAVGMSTDRLNRIRIKFQTYIDEKRAPGFVTLIARKGQVVHYETCGYRDLEKQLPMEKDTIFRIYSMTKPITSVALMMLYEQGKFQLHDPVSNYIPELGNAKVLKHLENQERGLVEQNPSMTIQHLLTHTSGLTSDLAHDNPDDEAERMARYTDPDYTLEKTIQDIAGYPLLHQPGAQFSYGVSTDVCGYLVQILSGLPFETYLQENVFAPLGMVDTAFHVTNDNIDRFASLYAENESDCSLQLHRVEGIFKRDFLVPTKSPFGSYGLVSTTEDYWRFVQMLLNGGEFDGNRLLGRKTIEYIAMNHVSPDLLPFKIGHNPWLGYGFGLGFAVVNDPAQTRVIDSSGTYFWGGAAATAFWIDPQEEIVAVKMTQIIESSLPIWDDIRVMTYQALID